MNTSNEHELNLIEHSINGDNETCRQAISNINGSLPHCGGLNSKFGKLKLFKSSFNLLLLRVIKLVFSIFPRISLLYR